MYRINKAQNNSMPMPLKWFNIQKIIKIGKDIIKNNIPNKPPKFLLYSNSEFASCMLGSACSAKQKPAHIFK